MRITGYHTIAAAMTLAAMPIPAAASEKGWDNAGSIARDALVVAAFGIPVLEGDWDGALQAGGSIAATTVLTIGMKQAFPSVRPDLSDNNSFPSGHTSVAFAAAGTIHNRHGWEAGLPAYLVASFVGLSRVEAGKHRVGDVLVGAALGAGTAHLVTRRKNDRVQIIPWGDTKSGGVAVAMRF
jgi:membrane-associated phospholipid phosphatase